MSDNQLQNIEQLLKDVGAKIEKSKEIARLKGENFNIFKILGLETKENKTHSNFLASLLNPKGEHGLGDTFLRLFFDTILSEESGITLTDNKREIVKLLKQDKVVVKTEMYLGKTNYDEVEGGRVDISLQSDNRKIFIENKIYAGDQYLQIARYVKDKKAVVFYLTLFGDEPSKDSSGECTINEDFFLLSYKEDIKNWLEKCQKEASDYPIIRETIKQYLILIKKLTGQLTSNEMEKEVVDMILKDEKSLESFFEILNFRTLIINNLIQNKFKNKIEDLAQKHKLECNFGMKGGRERWEGFSFLNENLKKLNLSLLFFHDSSDYRDFKFGLFYNNREIEKPKYPELKKSFEKLYKVKNAYANHNSPCFTKWKGNSNWNRNTFLKIYKGELILEIEDKLNGMLNLVSNM